MEAKIERIADNYYVATYGPGDDSIGSAFKTSLEAYLRKQGITKFTYIDKRKPALKVEHTL